MRITSQSGLNIFEVMWSVIIAWGVGAGAVFGYKHYGIWGAVLGVPLGGGIGLLATFVAAFLFAVVLKMLFGGTIFRPRPPKSQPPHDKS